MKLSSHLLFAALGFAILANVPARADEVRPAFPNEAAIVQSLIQAATQVTYAEQMGWISAQVATEILDRLVWLADYLAMRGIISSEAASFLNMTLGTIIRGGGDVPP